VIPVAVLFPAEGTERKHRFGPYEIEMAMDAVPLGQNLPLIVVSHGNSSTPWVFRDLTKHLAKQGFAVALFEHPGNNRRDNRLAGTVANLENRAAPYFAGDRCRLLGPGLEESCCTYQRRLGWPFYRCLYGSDGCRR